MPQKTLEQIVSCFDRLSFRERESDRATIKVLKSHSVSRGKNDSEGNELFEDVADIIIVCVKPRDSDGNVVSGDPSLLAVQPADGSEHYFLQHSGESEPHQYAVGEWEALIDSA